MRMEIPKISLFWLMWFKRYARWYVARQFHAVRISRAGRLPKLPDGPVIFVANHPSWWDPLILMLLSDLMPERQHYAPIDAAALKRYRFFAKLGMFGIEPGTTAGALKFIRTGRAILSRPATALWVTAQGRFADVRERPVQLRRGVEALGVGVIVPVALEYVFWQERFPEVLVRFGKPGSSLEETQDALAAEAMQREPELFDTFLRGRAGVGGVYDLWRRLRYADFRPEHGAIR